MKWYFGAETNSPLAAKKRVLTIGNFDGVHRGHQRLVSAVVDIAKNTNSEAGLVTFYPHPMQVLFPEKNHHRLFDLEDQKEQLQKLGLDFVWVQPFSREFSQKSASEFLHHFLGKFFAPSALVVGYDFSFGKDRSGDRRLLQDFCHHHKIHLQVLEAEKVDHEIISTSAIRTHLLQGNLSVVESMLGRKYYLKGIVEKGEQRGRQLSVPTANIHPVVETYPRLGVYVTKTMVAGLWHPSITNIGLNKTFVEGDLNPVKVETHIFNWSEEIYGREIKIELIKFLRDEKKFASIEELVGQIRIDMNLAKKEFA